MIDFMILYEIPTRELESVLILGNELKCRGYSVEYASFFEVSKDDFSRNRKKYKRFHNNVKVLLVPSFYHNNEMMDIFYLPFGKVEKIVDLRWEQYYVNRIMDDPAGHLYLFPSESGKNAFHVCWGDVSHRCMLEAGIEENRLLDTGPLHMDVLRDEFRPYFMSKKELFDLYGLDSEKKSVLFISSFANATDKTKTYQYYKQFFSGRYQVDYARIELERASYDLALEWFDDFLSTHADVEFIYRPHPSEFMTEKIKALEKKYSNFRIISPEHSVKQWILVSETIVTWMSTSIVEAFFAGKACFIIRPVEFPVDKDMCIYQNAKFISKKEDFMSITDVVCENSLSEDYIHQCYDVRPETPSYIRLCDALEDIYASPDAFLWDKKLTRKYDMRILLFALRSFGLKLKRKTKRLVIAVMVAVQKATGISYGKAIDQKLSVHENNRQIYNYSIGFSDKNDSLGKIVANQYEQRKAESQSAEQF